jgi:hypothetical protein
MKFQAFFNYQMLTSIQFTDRSHGTREAMKGIASYEWVRNPSMSYHVQYPKIIHAQIAAKLNKIQIAENHRLGKPLYTEF